MSSLEKQGTRNKELKLADAVVLTYACDEPVTFDRLSTYWLLELKNLEVGGCFLLLIILTFSIKRRMKYEWQTNSSLMFIMMQVKAPVIVVGCKLDLRDENRIVNLESLTSHLMQQLREIVTCVECSAATLYQVYCVAACIVVGW